LIGWQFAYRARQFVAARGRVAEPERDRRRRAFRVGDTHRAARYLQDQPRRVAELENVAGVALDREVFVQRADERVLSLEDHAIVRNLGDRSAARDREHARSSSSAYFGVHFVAMHE